MSDQAILSILFHAKPECAAELGSRLNALAKAVRTEPGSVHFNVHHVNEDQTRWLLYEVWQSNQDFIAHQKIPKSKRLNADLGNLLSEPPKALRLTLTSEISER